MIAITRRSHRYHQLLDAAFLRRSPRTALAWRLLLALSGWITMLGTVVLPSGSAPRAIAVFGFILICPGFAVTGLVPVKDMAERWVVAIALSTSVAILITVALTVLRIDSVTLRMALLSSITTLAVLIDTWPCPRGLFPIPRRDNHDDHSNPALPLDIS